MHINQINSPQRPAESKSPQEQQERRLSLSIRMLAGAATEACVFALFASTGTIPVWLAVAFVVVGVGSAVALCLFIKFGFNLKLRDKDMLIPQFLIVGLVQLGFLVLAPGLAVLFLLVLFVYSFFQLRRIGSRLSEKNQELQAVLFKIDQLARIDPLTGVLNRRTIMEVLEAELQRARRTGHPFCFVIIDLDRFKEVNEKFGHPVGDVVLRTVSDTSMGLLRELDRFGRLGGEEFGIVLPATWLDQGIIAMERLTRAVAACDWEGIIPQHALTFSAGITTNALGDTAELMTQRAEKALAQAKTQGGNRTVQAEEPLPEMPPGDD